MEGGDRLRRRTLVFGSLLRVGIASGSSSTRCHNGPSNSRKTGNTKGRRASCINRTKDTHSSCLVSPHYLTRACASTSLDRSGPAHRRTSFPLTCARLLVARAARAQGPAALIRKRKRYFQLLARDPGLASFWKRRASPSSLSLSLPTRASFPFPPSFPFARAAQSMNARFRVRLTGVSLTGGGRDPCSVVLIFGVAITGVADR